ncbi:MAG: hypothetical protein OEU26_27865 [Candidatus Tectomicrobia bacterium]|nr:hypothetical protein [Candidatus Tectomicrobia bacterium]
MARRLLLASAGEDERSILDWVAQDLTDTERQVLASLDARFEQMIPGTTALTPPAAPV